MRVKTHPEGVTKAALFTLGRRSGAPLNPSSAIADVSDVAVRAQPSFQGSSKLEQVLREAVAREASDVHLKVPAPPVVRVDGDLRPLPGFGPLTPRDTEQFLAEIARATPERAEEFARRGEADLAHSIPGLSRFRVNAFKQRGAISLVLRVVPGRVLLIADLGLPPVVARLAEEERGIVFVTGTTGSGKTSTLAAMIDRINRRMHKHIVTIEDPIEILHADRRSLINQREVGQDTDSFSDALRRVMRQDPDVIMIGEIRDLVTIETALNAAETGHLVLSTMHTLDAVETVNRAIGFFPLHQQQQVRAMLAGTLRGIISQRLVPRADGTGRVPAVEVLVSTGRARDMILDPDQTGRLHEVIREGEFYGMQTFDQSLFGHVKTGVVSIDDAMRSASSPHDFKLMLDAGSARRQVTA
jgi:twitching motility protein PilT